MTVHHLPGAARQHPADFRMDLCDAFAASIDEQEKVARVAAQVRRSLRIKRQQSFVMWFCLISALFAACYWGWQMGARGH